MCLYGFAVTATGTTGSSCTAPGASSVFAASGVASTTAGLGVSAVAAAPAGLMVGV